MEYGVAQVGEIDVLCPLSRPQRATQARQQPSEGLCFLVGEVLPPCGVTFRLGDEIAAVPCGLPRWARRLPSVDQSILVDWPTSDRDLAAVLATDEAV